MKKILIMMTEAGGGHRASAESLRDAFQEHYDTRFQIEIVDMWTKHTPSPVSRLPKAYRYLVNEMPWLYKWMFQTTQKPKVTRDVLDAFYHYVRKPISRALRFYAPDLIISVHPLMQHVPLRILSRMQADVPFVTVVTDWITIHPGWLHPDVTRCFVPNQEVYQMALEAGLQPEQVCLTGLPIRPAFARPPRPKPELRQELGMEPDLPAVLLVSGGEGMGPVARIARAVASVLGSESGGAGRPAGQLVVVCGRNKKLQEELAAETWPLPTIVNGFVQNMPEWMGACDCIITKAGPGTIAESLALGLPMVLSGYVIGQEEGNAPYVVQNRVGEYSEDPAEIARIVARWFGPARDEMAQVSERARQLGRPDATYRIVDEIAALMPAYRIARVALPETARTHQQRPSWL
jgi:1,2-diacylglycerol 3-beta-galactosyltransferase